MSSQNGRSLSDVLHDIVGNVQEIVRSEVRLATAEIKEEVANAAKAGRLLGAGIILALYGLGLLLMAAVYALTLIVAPWLAALIIGSGVSLIALIFISIGKSRLEIIRKPERTIESVKESVQWAKTQSK